MGTRKVRTTIYIDEIYYRKMKLLGINISAFCAKAIKGEMSRYDVYTLEELDVEKAKKRLEVKKLESDIGKIDQLVDLKKQEEKGVYTLERARAKEEESIGEWRIISDSITKAINEVGVVNFPEILNLLDKYKKLYPQHVERINRYHYLRAWRNTQVTIPRSEDEEKE